VQFCVLGNLALKHSNDTPVSHVSHRHQQKPCVKRIVYVKSASMIARGKGFEKASPPQKTAIRQLAQGNAMRRKFSLRADRFPSAMDGSIGFPFQYEISPDV
jgi:hypothetical protein